MAWWLWPRQDAAIWVARRDEVAEMGRSMLRPYTGDDLEGPASPDWNRLRKESKGTWLVLQVASDSRHLQAVHSQEWLCHATSSASCKSGTSTKIILARARFAQHCQV